MEKEEVGNSRGISRKYSLHTQENTLRERVASLQEPETHETGHTSFGKTSYDSFSFIPIASSRPS
jgi:hypothetical protein